MRTSTFARRGASLAALIVFLIGNNFCLVATPLSIACPTRGGAMHMAASAPVHACCAATMAKKQRADQATREATAPCCVAISATVVPAAAHGEAAPTVVVAILPVPMYSAEAASFARAASAEAVLLPPPRGATPDEGRAPPRN